jgi:hypothetical protein
MSANGRPQVGLELVASRGRQRALVGLVAFAALAALLWWRPWREEAPQPREPATRAQPQAAEPRRRRAPPQRRSPRTEPAAADLGNASPGELTCHFGDVWSLENGRVQKREECGARLCRDGSCAPVDAQPCREPLQGRCERDVVHLCIAGRTHRIDCSAQGLTCAMGDEGAECVPEIPRGERCTGATRCEGDVLVRCEQGRRVATDCAAERASCGVLPGERSASCVRVATEGPDCGPCGCPTEPGARETRCDGRDDDGDGLVDEGIFCGPVPVLAFVVRGADGQTSHAPEDIEQEVARLNEIFTSMGETAPTFELAELAFVDDGALLSASTDELSRLAVDPRVHPAHPEFYLPLVFTDALEAEGGVPRAGASTLPNGTCGGVHWGRSPEVGVILVAKGRAPTTVAHEVGHFLGLCHTHETRADAPVLAMDVGGQLAACTTPCRNDGDGVCDTPFDPGPETCGYDAECRTVCRTQDEPETSNLMSYYTECRREFSPDQLALMQHTLALRRGWHRCVRGACPCPIGGAGCPAGMSCRPLEQGGAVCGLDGPRAPGADCEATSDCSQGGQCVRELASGHQRCARPCVDSVPGCRCTPFGDTLSLCAEDVE